jgi:bacteriorhodopsin
MLNPLRSEDEAFRFLLYAIAVIGAIVVLILILRAIF